MNNPVVWMIAGMAAATYIPRMLPFILFQGKALSPFWQGVLNNVPYAMLGALIFPAILFLGNGNAVFGLVGLAAAGLLSYAGANVMVVVIASIGAVSLYSWIFQ